MTSRVRHYPIIPKDKKKHRKADLFADTAVENEMIQGGKSIYFIKSNDGEFEFMQNNYETRNFYMLKRTLYSLI